MENWSNLRFTIFVLCLPFISVGQVAPCGDDYGSSADEENIILKMRYGTIQEARNAIFQGMETRGVALGCPQEEVLYETPDFTEPSLTEIENIWNTVHKPAIDATVIDCPRIGRYENNAALGAYYATLAGYYDNLPVLASINEMMLNQQYSNLTVSSPIAEHEGVFGYLHTGVLDGCYIGGVVGSSVNSVCGSIPSLCVSYEFGDFSGEEFLVGDQHAASDFYDGGIAYDHGWIGITMIEAALQQTDSALKSRYKTSAILAANWAKNEFAVKNHNYTAKLIWLLSEMYLWSGHEEYKNELLNKLNRSLLPGILMDRDSDGFVDSLSTSVPFSSLNINAQTPGRMWDGHNALPWYSAMNAWALTEAYCAFRDRGDLTEANELKPYVIAMLDNLAMEIENSGVINSSYLGIRDLTYAFLIGVWKIAQYEGETHLNWEKSLWALWNTNIFETNNTSNVCVGLYLLIKSNTPYVPLNLREDFTDIQNTEFTGGLKIYPNPTNDFINLKFDNPGLTEYHMILFNLEGEQIVNKYFDGSNLTVNVSDLQAGGYRIGVRLMDDHAFKFASFIKN